MSDSAESIPDYSKPSQPQPSSLRAHRSVAAWLRLLIPAALGVAGDLWLKAWAFPDGVAARAALGQIPVGRYPAPYDSIVLIPKTLVMTTTVNPGAVFGMGKGWLPFFLAFSIVALALILWVFATSKRSHWIVHLALGLILAGALGNMYDRIAFHGVRDMLRFICCHYTTTGADGVPRFVDWYPFIFNFADVLLCVGVPILMLRWLIPEKKST